jgi:uncharacterized protein (TIGR00369 family)
MIAASHTGLRDGGIMCSATSPDEDGEASRAANAGGLLALMPYAVALGIEIESVTPDLAVGHLDWAPERCTAGGLMHGGVLMALADSIGAICAFAGLPEGSGTATTSSATNLFRGVRDGRVTARARPLHRGRTLIVVETELVDSRGRPVAKVTQSQAVLVG